MTKLCLECTKRYYFNVYIQNFPGEHALGPPLAGHGFAMLEPPPPKINLWTRPCVLLKVVTFVVDNVLIIILLYVL